MSRELISVDFIEAKPFVGKFPLKIPVTIDMIPSCRVMVYYVRKDKEVVADSFDFDVEDKLKNEVMILIFISDAPIFEV